MRGTVLASAVPNAAVFEHLFLNRKPKRDLDDRHAPPKFMESIEHQVGFAKLLSSEREMLLAFNSGL